MNIETIITDVKLRRKPTNGTEAYNLLVEALKADIEEKQIVLEELSDKEIREQVIRDWRPKVKNLAINNY